MLTTLATDNIDLAAIRPPGCKLLSKCLAEAVDLSAIFRAGISGTPCQ
jgi:hypothetical protein